MTTHAVSPRTPYTVCAKNSGSGMTISMTTSCTGRPCQANGRHAETRNKTYEDDGRPRREPECLLERDRVQVSVGLHERLLVPHRLDVRVASARRALLALAVFVTPYDLGIRFLPGQARLGAGRVEGAGGLEVEIFRPLDDHITMTDYRRGDRQAASASDESKPRVFGISKCVCGC